MYGQELQFSRVPSLNICRHCAQRDRPYSSKSENLVNETEIIRLQNAEADVSIRVDIGLIIKRIAAPHQIGTIEDRVRGTEHMQTLKKMTPADFPTGDHVTRVSQPRPGDV